jgi:hypothetical protein
LRRFAIAAQDAILPHEELSDLQAYSALGGGVASVIGSLGVVVFGGSGLGAGFFLATFFTAFLAGAFLTAFLAGAFLAAFFTGAFFAAFFAIFFAIDYSSSY